MRAVQIATLRQPLQQREIPRPVPGPGEVLVRITAAGICHSDVYYRDGVSPVARLPITPGHEIAGRISAVGAGPSNPPGHAIGDRVCLHYLITCGQCAHCRSGRHQWCTSAEMIGKDRDGGYAEYIKVPEKNAIRIPDTIVDEHAAVMMCSSATALHAIRKARLQEGDTISVFGCGGLGISAIKIAAILGAESIIAVDLDSHKLGLAEALGATAVDASKTDPVSEVRRLTNGSGADVCLELVGSPRAVQQAVQSVGIGGRIAVAGITNQGVPINPYTELIAREAEVIGVSDHLPGEIHQLLEWAAKGLFPLHDVVTRSVELDIAQIEDVFGELKRGVAPPRTIIVP